MVPKFVRTRRARDLSPEIFQGVHPCQQIEPTEHKIDFVQEQLEDTQ